MLQRDPLLGPVELDILSFAASHNPILAVLVGGMGSGKSTTIRFLTERYLQDYKIILCDLNANMQTAASSDLSDNDVADILTGYLSAKLNTLITPDEEYKGFWTWALSAGEYTSHPGKHILSAAQDELRDTLGNDWQAETPEAIALRKQCRKLLRNSLEKLTYQGLRIDYFLTACCKGDRSRLLIILDNVDPLSPRLQFQILDLAISPSRCCPL
jgi:hypothetical protein